MTKKISLYALALLRSLDGVSKKEQQKRAARFKNLLKKRGDLRLLPSVLQEFEKLWEQRKGKIAALVSAQKLSSLVASHMKAALKKKGYLAKEAQDPGVIGGAAVFLGSEYLFDNTVKGKLQKLKEIVKA